MIVANSDQFVVANLKVFNDELLNSDTDGAILTMEASGNKWSYVKKNANQNVEIVVEKKQISNEATVGIYGWSKVSDFQKSFLEMEVNKDKVNNEYYLAPTYNYLISDNKIIKTVNVGKIDQTVFGLGTPEDLVAFGSYEVSKIHASIIYKKLMLKGF
jgi:hypothetical protein